MATKLKFIIAFLISISFLASALWYEKELRIDEHLIQKTKTAGLNYNAIYNKYKTLSAIILETVINKSDILLAFELAKKDKELSRDNLYNLLYDDYETLIKYNLKQLHFHLPNNESLLRFHRHNDYGDDLTQIRKSVEFVNNTQKPYHGFEEGRIYNGYRFVYPLFNHLNNYLGSVEISFSTLAFNEEFIKNYHSISNFFISKSIVKSKVLENELNNYSDSIFENFYIEKELLDSLRSRFGDDALLQIDPALSSDIESKILEGKPFSFFNKQMNQITTLIPIENELSKKIVGVISINSSAYYIQNKTDNFIALLMLGSSVLALFFIFVYQNHKNKIKIQKDAMTLETIFKEVDSGIGVIDIDGNFLKVNQKFAQLLGYSRGELLMLNCSHLLIKDERDKFIKALKLTKKRGLLSRMNNRYLTKKGQKVHFETSLRVLLNKEKFIIVINSIEDKLKLEELNDILDAKVKQQVRKLRVQDDIMIKQNRLAAIGEMVNSTTQIWNTPIVELRKQMKTLKTAVVALTKNQELAQAFDQNSQTLDLLEESIKDFHAFFKPEYEKTHFSVKEAIENSMLQRATHLDFHAIKFEVLGNDFQIYGYRTYFLQVMLNLINNSKDAIVSRKLNDGVIRIELLDSQLIISDNGKGIPEDIFPKIFEPYVTTKSDGTGIGLYMVKQLIKMMDARIDAKNSTSGAQFIITFSQSV